MALTAFGCGRNLGNRLEFNGAELYYTETITSSEAVRLGQYLDDNDFFDGNRKTLQINKSGSLYELRLVIKKGLENDQEVVQGFKIIASQLSTNVFGGSQVDIHFCDEYLKTLRVVIPLTY